MANDGRIVFKAHREQAAAMIQSGAAVAHEERGKIVAIMLTGEKVDLTDAHPGSFGPSLNEMAILPSGHRIYEHGRTWEKELAA